MTPKQPGNQRLGQEHLWVSLLSLLSRWQGARLPWRRWHCSCFPSLLLCVTATTHQQTVALEWELAGGTSWKRLKQAQSVL